MRITRLTTAGLLACALGAVLSHGPAYAGGMDDSDIKLSGCLVRGEGDDDGYMLTNPPAEPAWQRSGDAPVAPSAVGTTGGFATVFYWLHGDDDLKREVGHRVEIEGRVDDELKEGQITLDRKDRWTELTVKADGRTMKANVPHTSVLPAPGSGGDVKSDVLVRRVDVEKVTMLAASCEP